MKVGVSYITVGKNDLNVLDQKAVAGTLTTAGAAVAGWLEAVGPAASFAVTIIVGGVTVWYTVERALLTRQKRKQEEEKEE